MNILKAQRIGYNKAIKTLEERILTMRTVSMLREKIFREAIEYLKKNKP